ncbi:hypothetical protein [Parapedobacter sp.]
MGIVNRQKVVSFWAVLMFLINWAPANAQTTVTLEESDTRNLIFTASIGKKAMMPVTFCLNVNEMSSGHRDWYSVSGWFQLKGDGEPRFSIAGIKTSELLTLYYFNNEALADTLLNFRYDDYEKYNFREMMVRYHYMTDFVEKMTFKDVYGEVGTDSANGRGIRGEWTDGKMRLPINVYRSDLEILQHHSLLKIHHNGSDFYIDLYALNLPIFYPGEHAVEGYAVVGDTVRVVLSYQRASKAYALGACGAGEEEGLLRLLIDGRNGHVLKLEDYHLFSCLKSITSKEGYQDEKQERYIVTDAESTRFLNFNKETMELEWEERGTPD